MNLKTLFLKSALAGVAVTSLMVSPSASAITIHGNLLYSATDFGNSPGIYTFTTEDAASLTPVPGGENILSHGGGLCVGGDTYYSINASERTLTVYDTSTWFPERTVSGVTPALGLAYDHAADRIYGCFVSGSPRLGILDPESGGYSEIGIMRVQPVAMVTDAASKLFAIGIDGGVYSVDKADASMTLKGNTGVAPFSVQGAVFDAASGKCYWAAVREDYSSGLYEVDLETGKASLLYDFPGQEEITGLFIVPEPDPSAPGTVAGFSAVFNAAETAGTVSFTMPDKTAGGAPLTGKLTWNFSANDYPASGQAAPGEVVSIPLSLSQGLWKMSVSVSNSAGEGGKSTISRWIGHDTPLAVSDLRLVKNASDALSLSWTLPAAGEHGGYVDNSALRCKVVRYPGNVTVADGIATTDFSETIEAPRLAPYWYVVTAMANGMASAPATSNRITMGAPKEMPYTEDFSSTIQFGNIMITDANADGMTWGHDIAGEKASYPGNSSGNTDEWMVTPPLALDASVNYRLRFDVCASSFDPYQIGVMLGTLPGISDLDTEIVASTNVGTPYEWRTIEANFHVAVSGEYYIGFHLTGAPNSGSFGFDNLSVEGIGSSAAPAAPANLLVEPDALGALGAIVTLTAPERLINGSPISDTFSVNLLRDGTLVNTFANVSASQSLSFRDTSPVQGFNRYTAVAVNNAGAGEEISLRAYIGTDIPGTVTDISLVETSPGHVDITWKAPLTGKNGGYVDQSALEYTVRRNQWKEVEAVQCSASDFIEESLTEQMFVVYEITASSAVGNGDAVTSELIVAGTPYEAPLDETFAAARPVYYPWPSLPMNSLNSWNAWSLADDGMADFTGDNGVMAVLCYSSEPEEIRLLSPKMAIGKTAVPRLKFAFAHSAISDNLDVEIIADGAGADLVASLPLNNGNLTWKEVSVPLDRYMGCDVIQLVFHTRNICGDDKLYIDGISFTDDVDRNLAAGALEAPVKLVAGCQASVKARVNNIGREKASGYRVDLYAGDNMLSSAAGPDIEAGCSGEVLVSFVPDAVYGDRITLHSEIVYDADQNQANNMSKPLSVPLETVALPGVTSLHGSTEEGVVILGWNAPILPESQFEVTLEDFESYSGFITSGIGEWGSIEGDPSNFYCMEFQNSNGAWIEFPGDYAWENYAFTTVDLAQLPAATPADGWSCVSGTKFVMTAYSAGSGASTPSGDYLISPRLQGCAQEISLNAKSLDYLTQGLETITVLASSTTADVSAFKEVGTVRNIPTQWTRYSFALPEGSLYFAVRSVSTKTALFIDDISYIADGASLITHEVRGYNVYRDTERLNSEPVAITGFTDTTADPQKTYAYSVSAVYSDGESAVCDPVVLDLAGLTAVTSVAPISVTSTPGMIHVMNCDGCQVKIYSLDGRLVASSKGDGAGRVSVAVPVGLYVVSAGSAVHKLVVR